MAQNGLNRDSKEIRNSDEPSKVKCLHRIIVNCFRPPSKCLVTDLKDAASRSVKGASN